METTTLRISRRRAGVLTLLGSALSNQTGAAIGSLAFPLIGPVAVVAVRQVIAAAILLPVARPRIWKFTWGQWWPVLLLAGVFGIMNLTLYLSIERIGLGLAVTLEFLGPLFVAILGTRSVRGGICAAGAALGVVAITRPEPSTDYVGLGLGLIAACCWAAYILLNRTIGRRVPGVTGAAAAVTVSAVLFLPVGIVLFVRNPPSTFAVLCAVGAGVLASAVPYIADLLALRRVPANLFGMLMSVNPVFAAAIGFFLLGEGIGILEWTGIALIVGANAITLAHPAPAPPVLASAIQVGHGFPASVRRGQT